MPLSVMEAMSCNLPVISTRFGVLPDTFSGGEVLFFVQKEEELYEKIQEIKHNTPEVRTREKVLPYSWERVIHQLEGIYDEVISG